MAVAPSSEAPSSDVGLANLLKGMRSLTLEDTKALLDQAVTVARDVPTTPDSLDSGETLFLLDAKAKEISAICERKMKEIQASVKGLFDRGDVPRAIQVVERLYNGHPAKGDFLFQCIQKLPADQVEEKLRLMRLIPTSLIPTPARNRYIKEDARIHCMEALLIAKRVQEAQALVVESDDFDQRISYKVWECLKEEKLDDAITFIKFMKSGSRKDERMTVCFNKLLNKNRVDDAGVLLQEMRTGSIDLRHYRGGYARSLLSLGRVDEVIAILNEPDSVHYKLEHVKNCVTLLIKLKRTSDALQLVLKQDFAEKGGFVKDDLLEACVAGFLAESKNQEAQEAAEKLERDWMKKKALEKCGVVLVPPPQVAAAPASAPASAPAKTGWGLPAWLANWGKK